MHSAVGNMASPNLSLLWGDSHGAEPYAQAVDRDFFAGDE